jgi:hypothetical protein
VHFFFVNFYLINNDNRIVVKLGTCVVNVIRLLDIKCCSAKVFIVECNLSSILHEISKRKANWIGHILCRNCLLLQVIEGKIKGRVEVTGSRGRRRKKLLNELKERRGYSHLKKKALDRTMWKARFGRGFVPVVRQTNK